MSTNLRLLLFTSSSPILSPLKPSLSFSLFPSKRHHLITNFARRRHSTTVNKDKDNKLMEENKASFGFNKRRAEGRDKSDKPKKELHLKVRKLNPVNTISYVQILGTGMDTQDTSPSVLLFFDRQRFIFNAGEGLQRFCTEHKIKLSKIDHIFLSRVCSETAGGLPGLLLTLAGMGEEGMSVNVWGPSDLKYMVDAMKSFIPNAAMVHTRSFGDASKSGAAPASDLTRVTEPIVLVDDEVVKISAFILKPNFLQDQNLIKICQEVKPGDISVIYVCELPEVKGKFHPEKAKELGLKPGPKYRELQLGNSVKSDKKDLMDFLTREAFNCFYADASGNKQDAAKSVTCVIHMSPMSVTSSPTYQNWMKRFGPTQHIIAGHTIENAEIPILKASARIAARLNYLCPQFFPAPGFWSVEHSNHSAPAGNSSCEDVSLEPSCCISAENLLKFTLRPRDHLGLDRSSVPRITTHSEIIDELFSEIPEITDAAQQVRRLWLGPAETEVGLTAMSDKGVIEEPWLSEDGSPSCLENIRRDDLEIVLLGTGSSQPSKYRNVSAVYINLFTKGSMLLDCGEGTLGQLKRRYGVEGADNAVKNLSCIWISHIHADHHTGLARVLALRRDLLRGVPHEPILVIGPRQLKRFLDAYQRLEDLDMQFLDCRNTTEASLDAFESAAQSSNPATRSPSKSANARNDDLDGQISKKLESTLFSRGNCMQSVWNRPSSPVDNSLAFPILQRLKKLLNDAGIEALISFPVVHCPQAFGVVLKAAERMNSVGKIIPGWKIVYSGDTRPCPEMVEASRGATVLIHEATFEDGMVEEAVARNHSTTKEAIEVGSSAGAYRIILTHFSQRYPKIPVFDESHMHDTCIAFDMMSINLADLHALPKILPFVKILFKDEMMVDDSEDVVPVASTAL